MATSSWTTGSYYENKVDNLKAIFGTADVVLESDSLQVGDKKYPIVEDVIIVLDPSQYPEPLKAQLRAQGSPNIETGDFSRDIQFTFGEEWQTFPRILAEHEDEFRQYFDKVDLGGLKNGRVCDIGCGIGRWSYFVSRHCREVVLVDFSIDIPTNKN